MAQIIEQAYQAIDGKIFESKTECEKYEAAKISNQAPMFYIYSDTQGNESLQFANDLTNIDFILLMSEDIKNTFIEARKNKFQENAATPHINLMKYDFKYSTFGLNGSELGLFKLQYFPKNQCYKWVLLEEYLDYLKLQMDFAEEAHNKAQLLYITQNT